MHRILSPKIENRTLLRRINLKYLTLVCAKHNWISKINLPASEVEKLQKGDRKSNRLFSSIPSACAYICLLMWRHITHKHPIWINCYGSMLQYYIRCQRVRFAPTFCIFTLKNLRWTRSAISAGFTYITIVQYIYERQWKNNIYAVRKQKNKTK